MKRILYILPAVLLFCLQSCVKEEEDLFDRPAAERMNDKLKEYSKILQDAPNGWKMEYFPETNQSMGGYTYFCSFANGETVMMGDLSLTISGIDLYPAGTQIASQYKLIADQGPVLSFDSYNPLFHYFSEPKSMFDTDGYAGDYEFVFMRQEGNRLIMKGKKYGNTMVLTRMESSPKEELDQILETQSMMVAIPYGSVDIAGKEYPLEVDYNERQFIIDDSESGKQSIAFLFTREGIRFYRPTVINGEELYEFRLNREDKTIAAVGAQANLVRTPWIKILTHPTTQYIFDFNVAENKAAMNAELFDLLKAGYAANTGELFQIMYIGKNHLDNASGPTVIAFGSNGGTMFYYPSYGCELTATGDNKDLLDIQVDFEQSNMMSWYPWCESIAKYIADHSPYRLEDVPAGSPNSIKCISVADPNVWFELK